MNLPTSQPPEGDLTSLSLISKASERREIDRSIVDKALVRQIAQDLPLFYDKLKTVALTAEHDSDAVSALKTLIDRAAGKTSQDVNLHATLGVFQLPQEEVVSRIASLRENRGGANLTQEAQNLE